MNELGALMQGVIEDPKDDVRFLILADWHEEKGDPFAEQLRFMGSGKSYKYTKTVKRKDFDFVGRYSDIMIRFEIMESYIGAYIYRLDIACTNRGRLQGIWHEEINQLIQTQTARYYDNQPLRVISYKGFRSGDYKYFNQRRKHKRLILEDTLPDDLHPGFSDELWIQNQMGMYQHLVRRFKKWKCLTINGTKIV